MANADDIAAVLAGSATWALIEADCLNVLREMPDACVDAVVTDPPAGMAFMQAEWDDFRRARNPNDTGRNSVFGRMSSHGPEYGRDRSWEQPVSEHGFTDGGERLPAPTIGSSRNPMCRTCHKHKRGWKDHPGCQCATPDYDDEHHLGTRDHFIEWLTAIMQECLRVLKPGGHALVWSIPRTSHWTATAIEDSGFEIRDKIAELYSTQDAWQELIGTLGAEQLTMLARALGDDSCVLHIFGSGFPKSLDVSKAIDKAAGAERKVVGYDASRARPNRLYEGGAIGNIGGTGKVSDRTDNGATLTAPATPEAAQWAGFGTALKPACEHWILARKPIERTVAANVLKWGTGAINVDACRVATSDEWKASTRGPSDSIGTFKTKERTTEQHGAGRWPANLVLSHTSECRCVGTKRVKSSDRPGHEGKQSVVHVFGPEHMHSSVQHADADGRETVEAWECAPGCAVAELDRQSGELGVGRWPGERGVGGLSTGGHSGQTGLSQRDADAGGASRFFYTAKASRSERDQGLAHLPASTGGQATDRVDGSAGLDSPRAGAGRKGGITQEKREVLPGQINRVGRARSELSAGNRKREAIGEVERVPSQRDVLRGDLPVRAHRMETNDAVPRNTLPCI